MSTLLGASSATPLRESLRRPDFYMGLLESVRGLALTTELFYTIVGAQLAVCAILGVLYLNYVLFVPYLMPFCLALALSVSLRQAKDQVIDFLRPLEEIEQMQQLSTVRGWFRKMRALLSPTKTSATAAAYALFVLFASCCAYLVHASVLLRNVFAVLGSGVLLACWPVAFLVFFRGKQHTVVSLSMIFVMLALVAVLAHVLVLHVHRENARLTDSALIPLLEFFNTYLDVSITPEMYQRGQEWVMEAAENWLRSMGYDVQAIQDALESLREQYAGISVGGTGPEATLDGGGWSLGSLEKMLDQSRWAYHQVVDGGHMGILNQLVGVTRSSLTLTSNVILQLSSMLLDVGYITYNFTTSLLIFLWSLFLLLRMQTGSVSTPMGQYLPIPTDLRESLFQSLETCVRHIFYRSLLLFLVHALSTWSLYTVFDVRYPLASAVLAGLIVIIPYISGLVMFVPVFIAAMVFDYAWPLLIYYLLVVILVVYVLDPMVDELFPLRMPELSAVSVVLGVYAFGFSGFLVGPILVASVDTFVLAYHSSNKFHSRRDSSDLSHSLEDIGDSTLSSSSSKISESSIIESKHYPAPSWLVYIFTFGALLSLISIGPILRSL